MRHDVVVVLIPQFWTPTNQVQQLRKRDDRQVYRWDSRYFFLRRPSAVLAWLFCAPALFSHNMLLWSVPSSPGAIHDIDMPRCP